MEKVRKLGRVISGYRDTLNGSVPFASSNSGNNKGLKRPASRFNPLFIASTLPWRNGGGGRRRPSPLLSSRPWLQQPFEVREIVIRPFAGTARETLRFWIHSAAIRGSANLAATISRQSAQLEKCVRFFDHIRGRRGCLEKYV